MDLAKETKKKKKEKAEEDEVPIIARALGTAPRSLRKKLVEQEIKERIAIIQTTALLISTRILQRMLKTWGHLLLLGLQRNEQGVK